MIARTEVAPRPRLVVTIPGEPVADRFWAKVHKTDGCWTWVGARTRQGYGGFWIAGRTLPAHRVAMMLNGVAIPDGMFVCHKCDNPACVNPAHLFLGFAADNSADMKAKGRQAKGSKNAAAKLSDDDVRRVIDAVSSGQSYRSVAVRFGIDRAQVSNIARGLSWGVAPVKRTAEVKRLTDVDIAKIKNASASGLSIMDCARLVGSCYSSARRVLRGERYREYP